MTWVHGTNKGSELVVASNVAIDRETEFISQGSYIPMVRDKIKAKRSLAMENLNK